MRCDVLPTAADDAMRCDATLRAMRGDADVTRWALHGDAVRRRWGTKAMRCSIYGDTDFHLPGHVLPVFPLWALPSLCEPMNLSFQRCFCGKCAMNYELWHGQAASAATDWRRGGALPKRQCIAKEATYRQAGIRLTKGPKGLKPYRAL